MSFLCSGYLLELVCGTEACCAFITGHCVTGIIAVLSQLWLISLLEYDECAVAQATRVLGLDEMLVFKGRC